MLIGTSLSSLLSNPENCMLSNETSLLCAMLFFLNPLLCLKKAAGVLRAATCHMFALPHLMTPHRVTPVHSQAYLM